MTTVLSSSLSAHKKMRQRNEQEPKPLEETRDMLNGDSLRQEAETRL